MLSCFIVEECLMQRVFDISQWENVADQGVAAGPGVWGF